MQEVALGHIPALVPSQLLQIQGLRNDHPLIGRQLGVDIEGVAWVQGEHDPGLHLSNVGGRLPGVSPNRCSLRVEITEILRRLSLRQLRRYLGGKRREPFLSATTEYPRMRWLGSRPTRAGSTSCPPIKQRGVRAIVPSESSSVRTCTSSFLGRSKRGIVPRVLLAVIEPSLIGQAVRSLPLESSKSDALSIGRSLSSVHRLKPRSCHQRSVPCPDNPSPPPNGHGFGVALPRSMEYRDNLRGGRPTDWARWADFIFDLLVSASACVHAPAFATPVFRLGKRPAKR